MLPDASVHRAHSQECGYLHACDGARRGLGACPRKGSSSDSSPSNKTPRSSSTTPASSCLRSHILIQTNPYLDQSGSPTVPYYWPTTGPISLGSERITSSGSQKARKTACSHGFRTLTSSRPTGIRDGVCAGLAFTGRSLKLGLKPML